MYQTLLRKESSQPARAWPQYHYQIYPMPESRRSQWLFQLSALRATPTSFSTDKELYDRARGVEFLFRLGSSLALFVPVSLDIIKPLILFSPSSAMFTAATWFHRFYMRYSMEDFHRQVTNSDPAATLDLLMRNTTLGCCGIMYLSCN